MRRRDVIVNMIMCIDELSVYTLRVYIFGYKVKSISVLFINYVCKMIMNLNELKKIVILSTELNVNKRNISAMYIQC